MRGIVRCDVYCLIADGRHSRVVSKLFRAEFPMPTRSDTEIVVPSIGHQQRQHANSWGKSTSDRIPRVRCKGAFNTPPLIRIIMCYRY